jgi:hypothetical protein
MSLIGNPATRYRKNTYAVVVWSSFGPSVVYLDYLERCLFWCVCYVTYVKQNQLPLLTHGQSGQP